LKPRTAPQSIFRRTLERRNLIEAEAAAKELPSLNLAHAVDLTLLVASKDPRRHPRVATQWLLRSHEECDQATIDEASVVAAASHRSAVNAMRKQADASPHGRGWNRKKAHGPPARLGA
jgi:hypothetical protein